MHIIAEMPPLTRSPNDISISAIIYVISVVLYVLPFSMRPATGRDYVNATIDMGLMSQAA